MLPLGRCFHGEHRDWTADYNPLSQRTSRLAMNITFRLGVHCVVGLVVTLLSTFAGERSHTVTFPDIMGCENGCSVVATGWPLIFVTDYLGMSVVNTANISEVWLASDRVYLLPFLLNLGVWTVMSLVATRLVVRFSTRTVFSSPTDR